MKRVVHCKIHLAAPKVLDKGEWDYTNYLIRFLCRLSRIKYEKGLPELQAHYKSPVHIVFSK